LGHVSAIARIGRTVALGSTLACAAVLGGCGGIEFEGKVFDYMGVSGNRQQADVQMSERPPLMVPPNLNKLPAPGQGATVAAARQDWPDDPEKVRVRVIEAENTKKAEAEAAADPLNAYAGKETLLDKLFGSKKTVEEPIPDVPEPNPSDRAPTVAQTQSKPISPHVPEAPLPDRNEEAFKPAAPDSYNKASSGQTPPAF
jgi:hypothetical protein